MDGRCGTAPDPLVWDQGSKPETRKIAVRVHVDLASLFLALPGFLGGPWIQVHGGRISGADICCLALQYWYSDSVYFFS